MRLSLSIYFRYAIVTFDAMAVRPNFRYNELRDCFEGFEDTNMTEESRCSKLPAEQLFIVMLKGISRKWKQVIGYYLLSKQFSKSQINSILQNVFQNCHASNITPVAIVCDMETRQQALATEILRVNYEKSFFNDKFTENKIFFVFDPPHIMKCLRNNFQSYDIEFKPGKFARWDHIKALWNLECQAKIRLVLKLSASHIFLGVGQKMKVVLAIQIFSHSVAAAIRTYVDYGLLSKTAVQTAEFIEEINDLWDIMNSNSFSQIGLKRPIIKDQLNKTNQILQRTYENAKGWKFIDQRPNPLTKEKTTLPFKKCLLITLRTFIDLPKYLFEDLNILKFLCGRRLNQDCVENVFCQIRRDKGSFYESVDAWRAIANMKCVAVTSYLTPIKTSGNCEDNGEKMFLDIHMQKLKIQFTEESTDKENWEETAEKDDIRFSAQAANKAILQPCNTLSYKKESIQNDVIHYISGYCIKKLFLKNPEVFSCEDCYQSLCDISNESLFQKHKTFKNAKCGLLSPSKLLVILVNQWEKIFQEKIDCYFTKYNVSKCFYKLFIKQKIVLRLCSSHKNKVLNFLYKHYLRVRLHHEGKMQSQKLKSDKLKNLRKLSKLRWKKR